MASSTLRIAPSELANYPGGVALPASSSELHWYAVYTRANHEKRVAAELHARTIEYFLPLYSSVRRWKDRRVTIDLPLFPGYVFVRMVLEQKLRVQQIPSVVRLVGFNGLPTALPDEDMEILRLGLTDCRRAEPHPFLKLGRRVRIKSGPLTGLSGVLLRQKSNYRFVLSMQLIQRAVIVDVDLSDIDPAR